MFNPITNPSGNLRNGGWIVIYLAFAFIPFGVFELAERYIPLHLNEATSLGIFDIFLILAAIACQAMRRRPLRQLGLQVNPAWLRQLGIGGAIGATLMIVTTLIIFITLGVSFTPVANGYRALLPVLFMFFTAGFAEELLFRGFMFQRLIDGIGTWPALIVAAILFAMLHWNNGGMTTTFIVVASINIFLAGIMLGLAFIRTRSLAMPVGIHVMWNYLQGAVFGFGVSGTQVSGMLSPHFRRGYPLWFTGGDFGPEASLPAVVVLTLACIMLYRWKGTVYPTDPLPSQAAIDTNTPDESK